MSSLTEQERIGLEEVFLSISSNRKRQTKLFRFTENIRAFLKLKKAGKGLLKPMSMLHHVKKRLKSGNLLHLLPKKGKKKKNLS